MPHDLLRNGDGRFWRGNLHCHSNRSDGQREPARVAAAYREAGYDFIALSDHFEKRYGWRITDTRALRTRDFSTLIAAELSSGSWDEPRTYWVSAVGLPTELDPPPAADPAEVIRRVHGGGAFVVLLHPALNHLPVQASGHLSAFDAIDAVEIYNHSTFGSAPDRADGAYMVDGLLDRGRHVMLTAGDDAHFAFPADRFGGWIEVWAEELDPVALLASLRAGAYYSTRGRGSSGCSATAIGSRPRRAPSRRLRSAGPATAGWTASPCWTRTAGRSTTRPSTSPRSRARTAASP